MGVAALLGFAGVWANPTVPWSLAGVLVLIGVAGLWEPRLFRVGIVAAWTGAFVTGHGWWLAPALGLGALRWNRVSSVLVGLALLIAARQAVAARELPAAWDVVPMLLVTLVLAAAAWAAGSPRPDGPWPWAERPGLAALGLVGAGAMLLVRVGVASSLEGVAQLRAAEQIQAVPLFYDRMRAKLPPSPRSLEEMRWVMTLVQAVPDQDEAARLLPVETALGLGWRPRTGGANPVPVALALEARGRGGEALRVLARHPRTGAVDWYRAILERTQGIPSAWRGGIPEGIPVLRERLELGWVWDTNAYQALLLHVETPLANLVVSGEGTPYEGNPVVTVRLDANPPVAWVLAGAGEIVLPGPVEAGPHRIELRFETDRVGPGGDRNVRIEALSGG